MVAAPSVCGFCGRVSKGSHGVHDQDHRHPGPDVVTTTAGTGEGRPAFTIEPSGPFSLQESATFGFGQRQADVYDGVMRLAFCLDGYRDQVGVALRQDAAGVHAWVEGEADLAVVRAHVARVLSLDHDGREYEAVGGRDPVVARLQAVAPGLRPPLFHSPYEAAAWSVLSARRPATQMAEVRRRLSEAHGRSFSLAGQRLYALPTPEQLLGVQELPGIPELKIHRLHAVAAAALEGRLDAARLRDMGVEAATDELCRLEGIGPFYSALIMIRASGLADVLPSQEPTFLALVGQLYDLPVLPGAGELAAIAEAWRPFRTWVAVLVRAAAGRL